MLYGGIVIALLGMLLWFTVAPGLGAALIVIGVIVALIGLFVDHRRI